MATVKFKGSDVHTAGSLPAEGSKAPAFSLTDTDLGTKTLEDFKGSKVVLNIFPSVDTGVCAASVRKFNEEASKLDNTKVLCISKDLPFALARFCGAEGLDNVISLSDFKNGFAEYGVVFTDGPLDGLLSRSVVVVDEEGQVVYTEQVAETVEEPNYEAAIAALS
ncbi:thiol peroxidase [Neptunitalea lumnitzerae]|uniref:Thiol peroxidase n=1 Tax=Neptunitalea lumnitzerae TaxID=2965509 RepID=A0ABQ5ML34_9FLAO|nr:thiol peroxidase [Neptunitalea sp. Y10]GLB50088.1 putative thiol peroxidase [Neptunitalea sp. Y10]